MLSIRKISHTEKKKRNYFHFLVFTPNYKLRKGYEIELRSFLLLYNDLLLQFD